jgi:hypothetical protein
MRIRQVMHYQLKGIYSNASKAGRRNSDASDVSKGWENESYASPHCDASDALPIKRIYSDASKGWENESYASLHQCK